MALINTRPQRTGMADADFLKPGNIIQLMHNHEKMEKCKVLGYPQFIRHSGSVLSMRVKTLNLKTGGEYYHYLSDLGVMPYFGCNLWNADNWIIGLEEADPIRDEQEASATPQTFLVKGAFLFEVEASDREDAAAAVFSLKSHSLPHVSKVYEIGATEVFSSEEYELVNENEPLMEYVNNGSDLFIRVS